MVTVNTEVKQPENPPKDWGITVRKRKVSDFIVAIFFSVLALVTAVYAYNPSAFGDELSKDDRVVPWVIAAVLAFVALCSTSDAGGRYREADFLAQQKSAEWQKEVLIPYLEKRYGITFRSEAHLFGWGFPRAYKGNRSIEVNIHGLNSERTSFRPGYDGSQPGYRMFNLTDIWAEEVIRPESIRFRALEEAGTDDSQE